MEPPSQFFQQHFTYKTDAETQRKDLLFGHPAVDMPAANPLVAHDFVDPVEVQERKAMEKAKAYHVPSPHYTPELQCETMSSLRFPSVHSDLLWDRTSQGSSIRLRPHRLVPAIDVKKSVLNSLLYHFRQLKESSVLELQCFLVCELGLNKQENACSLHIKRYDPGEPTSTISTTIPEFTATSSSSQADIAPGAYTENDVCIKTTLQKSIMFNVSDYIEMIEEYLSRCSRPCHSFSLSDHFVFIGKVAMIDEGQVQISCGYILPFVSFLLTPINPLRVIPTSLAQSLQHDNTTIQSGYLTMDQNRRLLTLLQTDSKSLQVPLVGIWCGGVSSIDSAYVHAMCLRYLHNSSLEAGPRLHMPSPRLSFLILVFTSTSNQPLLYDCALLNDTPSELSYNQYSRKIVVNDDLPKYLPLKLDGTANYNDFEKAVGLFSSTFAPRKEERKIVEDQVPRKKEKAVGKLGSPIRVIKKGEKKKEEKKKEEVEQKKEETKKNVEEKNVVLTVTEHKLLLEQVNQLQELKSEVSELKTMLSTLINNQPSSPSYPHKFNVNAYIGEDDESQDEVVDLVDGESNGEEEEDEGKDLKMKFREALTMIPVPGQEEVQEEKKEIMKHAIGVSVLPPLPSKPLPSAPLKEKMPSHEGETILPSPELSVVSRDYLQKYGLLDYTLYGGSSSGKDEEDEGDSILSKVRQKPLRQIGANK